MRSPVFWALIQTDLEVTNFTHSLQPTLHSQRMCGFTVYGDWKIGDLLQFSGIVVILVCYVSTLYAALFYYHNPSLLRPSLIYHGLQQCKI